MQISQIISRSFLSRLDAEVLLAHILDKPREWLFTHSDSEVSMSKLAKFHEFEEKRTAGKSVAAIIGQKEFFGLDFFVDENVLIPRPETEILVEEVINTLTHHLSGGLTKNVNLLDVGTGSGAIAIAVKKNLPACRVAASDISKEALAVARKNAVNIGVEVEFIESDLLGEISGKFDVLAANLPYVPEGSTEIQKSVADFEPRKALFAGVDGLDLIRKLLLQIAELPKRPKFVLLEFGGGEQVEVLKKLAEELLPASKIEFIRDLAGHRRVLKLSGLQGL